MKNQRVMILCISLILLIFLVSGCDAGGGGTSYQYPIREKKITVNAVDCFQPSLAWNGTGYCAVWQGKYDDGHGLDMEIGYALLDAEGNTNLNSYIIMKGDSEAPKVIWNGSHYWMAWGNYPDGQQYHEIYMHRVGSGVVYKITTTGGTQIFNHLPSLCWTGTVFGLAWTQDEYNTEAPPALVGRKVYFTRVDTNGANTGPNTVVAETGFSACPSLVWNGSEFALSWQDERDGNREIYFARLDSNGTKIGSDVRISNDAGTSENPCLVWNGTRYAVAWHDNRSGRQKIYAAFITAAGEKQGGDITITSGTGDSMYASLVWAGDKYALAWHDNRDGNYDVFMTYVSAAGVTLDSDHQISFSNFFNWLPSLGLIWNGSSCAVVYGNREDGDGEIYFSH